MSEAKDKSCEFCESSLGDPSHWNWHRALEESRPPVPTCAVCGMPAVDHYSAQVTVHPLNRHPFEPVQEGDK